MASSPSSDVSKKVSNPKQIILDSYDFLINQIDIHAETVLANHTETDLIDTTISSSCNTEPQTSTEKRHDYFDILEENVFADPFKEDYQIDEKFKSPLVDPTTTTVHDYVNKMRQEMIDELNKVQEETLKQCEMTNKDESPIERLEKEKSLFGKKYCFILETAEKSDTKQEVSKCPIRYPFGMYLFVLDFYVDPNLQKYLE